MIHCVDLVKDYRVHKGVRRVLDHINLDVRPGQKLGILGRNGAGKSTLIKLIGGVELPTSGRIERTMSVSWPLAFSGAFQGSLSGLDNLRFICRIYGLDYETTRRFVDDFAELGPQLREPVKTYSSGMRARLAFSLSIAIEFECYLIDEVIMVGDARFYERCKTELFDKRGDRALILVSHDMNFIRDVCDTAGVIHDRALTMCHSVPRGDRLLPRAVAWPASRSAWTAASGGKTAARGSRPYAAGLASAVPGAGFGLQVLAEGPASATRALRWWQAATHLGAHPAPLGPAGTRRVGDAFRLAQVHFDMRRRFLPLADRYAPPALMHWTYPVPLRFRSVPNVYTIHDLIPLLHPTLTGISRPRMARLLGQLGHWAAHIVTVSEASRQEIIDTLGWPPDRVINTYQAVTDTPPDSQAIADSLARLGLERDGYIVQAGSVEPRKNVRRMVEAYRASGTRTPLVLAGPDGWHAADELRGLADTPGLRRLPWVDRPTLLALLCGARFIAAPSLAEGFGLTVAEGMAFGTPGPDQPDRSHRRGCGRRRPAGRPAGGPGAHRGDPRARHGPGAAGQAARAGPAPCPGVQPGRLCAAAPAPLYGARPRPRVTAFTGRGGRLQTQPHGW